MANGCIKPWGIGPQRPCTRHEEKAPASFERAKKRTRHQEAFNLTYVGRKLVLTLGYTLWFHRADDTNPVLVDKLAAFLGGLVEKRYTNKPQHYEQETA